MRNSTGTDFQPGTYGTIKESNRPCGRAPPSPLRINTILSFLGSQQCYVLGLIKEQLTCSAFHVDVCENDFIGYRQSFTFLIAFLRSRADHGGSHIPINFMFSGSQFHPSYTTSKARQRTIVSARTLLPRTSVWQPGCWVVLMKKLMMRRSKRRCERWGNDVSHVTWPFRTLARKERAEKVTTFFFFLFWKNDKWKRPL